MRKIGIGDSVTYIDPNGVSHNALVKQCWGITEYKDGTAPAINLVYVVEDPNLTDSGGRQTKVETSVGHRSSNPGCPGRHWFQE